MADLQQEMEAFFAEYTERWNDQDDFSSLIEMWDTDDEPYYRPMDDRSLRQQKSSTY